MFKQYAWPLIRQLLQAHKGKVFLCALVMLLLVLASVGLMAAAGLYFAFGAGGALVLVSILAAAWLIRFSAILKIVAAYIQNMLSHRIIFDVLCDLRLWFYRRLLPFSPLEWRWLGSADLLNRVLADINALDHLFIRFVMPVVTALMAFVVFGILCGVLHFAYGWFVILPLLFLVVVLCRISWRYAYELSAQSARQMQQLRKEFLSLLDYLMVWLMSGTSYTKADQLQDLEARLWVLERRLDLLQALVQAMLLMLMGGVLLGLLYALEASLLAKALVPAGALVLLMVYLVLPPFLLPLPLAFCGLGKTLVSAKRVMAVDEGLVPFTGAGAINEHTDKTAVGAPKSKDSKASPGSQSLADALPARTGFFRHGDIVFKDVSYGYRQSGAQVLDGLSMHIAAGQKCLITAPSGSGKSTLLNILAQLIPYSKGSITISGQEIADISLEDYRCGVGYQTQSSHLFNRSILSNITLGQRYTRRHIHEVLAKFGLADWLKGLPEGLNTFVGDAGARVSGGQRRRLDLVRLYLSQKSILLLDEPFEGLDKQTAQEILALFCSDPKRTVIIASHQVDFIKPYMDKIVDLG